MIPINPATPYSPVVTTSSVPPPANENSREAPNSAGGRLRPASGSAIAVAALEILKNRKRANQLFSLFAKEQTLTPKTRDLLASEGVQDASAIILSQDNLSMR
jgi:hypothetical protein